MSYLVIGLNQCSQQDLPSHVQLVLALGGTAQGLVKGEKNSETPSDRRQKRESTEKGWLTHCEGLA